MRGHRSLPLLLSLFVGVLCLRAAPSAQVGAEVGLARHLRNGDEFSLPLRELLAHGQDVFEANWTGQEGGGRPLTKGSGAPLADPADPLVFPRSFNRVSAPDANSCAGCHNSPFGLVGGGGDFVTNVFVLAQRFDFATMNQIDDGFATKGSRDEVGNAVTLQSVGNSRATLGMFGSGYIEMLARQMTADLQAVRDRIAPSGSARLVTKGMSFGVLARGVTGEWITSGVEGLSAPSLASAGPSVPPSLIIRPFHQAGAVVSLRQFTNNAMNHHHGIQAEERFGVGVDADGDGFVTELTSADVTAVTLFQATLPVPGRVMPRDPRAAAAARLGERLFERIGCAECHRPALPLTNRGWVFTEPNPYNPVGNRRPQDGPVHAVDLSDPRLPHPRLPVTNGVVWVPAFTDLKLHDICDGPLDPNVEGLDMQQPAGSPGFFAGNRRFLTRKLWGAANEPPYFHHGMFTTLREAIQAHGGEAAASRAAFSGLGDDQRNAVIEFLKTLQVLRPDRSYGPRDTDDRHGGERR